MSIWKPILLVLPFAGWAWVVSKILDKQAERFHLDRDTWGAIHLSVGLVAFLVALLMPIEHAAGFFAGLGVLIVILVVEVVAFAAITNKDERVPEKFRLKLNLETLQARRDAKAAAKEVGKSELTLSGPEGRLAVPDKETPEFEVRTAAERLFLDAIDRRGVRVDIGPTGKDTTYGISFMVDGVRQAGDTLPGADAVKLIDVWKAAAGLDLTDRRRRLTGKVNVALGDMNYEAWLTTLGTKSGPRLTMRIDPHKTVDMKREDLGFLEQQDAEIDAMVAEQKGAVIIASPPMGGRTTTFYAMVRMHDAYTNNIQTLEVEALTAVEGVRQDKFDPTADGPDHSTTVRSMLRRDPDVIGVADMLDAETAREIAHMEIERTRVYVGIPAEDGMKAIEKWMKAVGNLEEGAKALHGVIAQRLVRRLCQNCRVAYQPSPDMLKKLGLPADKIKQLYKKGGQVLIKNKPEVCPVCQGNGYFGQIGVFEVYHFGPEERALLATGNLSSLQAELRKKRLPTIQQAALRRAVEGTTSIEEIMRISAKSGGGKEPAKAKPTQPQPAT